MQAHANWERRLLTLATTMPAPMHRPVFSYWAGDHSLGRAYRLAEQITARHSKSFYFASAFLPEEKRLAIRALYAFCRTVDDLVDEAADSDPEIGLNYWRTVTQSAMVPDGNPLALVWVDTLLRYSIPRQYALQLIDGVQRDLRQTRYRTFDELATYCYGVASTVGLMSMYIIGFHSSEAIPYAIRLGVALQLTNILRDVGEDYRNGRVYLPQEELLEYGLSEADLAAGRVTPAWRRFMQFQIERARRLYAEAWEGIAFLEREGRFAVAAALLIYQGILDRIEQNDYDVFHQRASLSAWEKVKRLPLIWWKMRRLPVCP